MAACCSIGGVLGDADGRRRLLLGALGTMLVTAVIGLFVTDGPVFVISRIVGLSAASVTLPMALAGVAVTYDGIPRATAIGIAYAAYGAATAAGPILLTLFGPDGPTWPAFVAAAVASVVALAAARSGWHDLPVPARGDRRAIWATATWAFGIVLLASGIIGFRTRDDPLRPILVVAGVVVLVLGLVFERLRPHVTDIASRVDRRAVAVALFVGFIVGYAQTVPLLQLPIYFQIALGYGPILAVAATIPFMAALVVAGPVAGILIGRFQPRTIVVWGVAAVGAGNLLAALLLGPRVPLHRLRLRDAADRCRVRGRHDRPDGHHLRQRAARSSCDRGGAQRGLRLDGRAGRPRAGHHVHRDGARPARTGIRWPAGRLPRSMPPSPRSGRSWARSGRQVSRTLMAGTARRRSGGIWVGLHRGGPDRPADERHRGPGRSGHRRDRARSA